MSRHNVEWENESNVRALQDDFGSSGIKADVIGESTSGAGITLSNTTALPAVTAASLAATGALSGLSLVTTGAVTAGTALNTVTVAASGAIACVGFQDTCAAAVTATTGGATTGLIPASTSLAIVTSDSADKQVSLPAATVGHRIRIVTDSTGCELISAVAAHKVNGVTVGATNEAALAADSYFDLFYWATNEWAMVGYTQAGAHSAAVVPDAL